MDAETLAFADSAFDLICGTAILNHLDLPRALAELARVLRPGGTAIFMEPLGHNPLIYLYRALTPDMRTPDEHPLRMDDVLMTERYFGQVQKHFFTLHTLLGVPFRGMPGFLRLLGALDRLLFRLVPPAARYAWQLVLELSQPTRAAR